MFQLKTENITLEVQEYFSKKQIKKHHHITVKSPNPLKVSMRPGYSQYHISFNWSWMALRLGYKFLFHWLMLVLVEIKYTHSIRGTQCLQFRKLNGAWENYHQRAELVQLQLNNSVINLQLNLIYSQVWELLFLKFLLNK